jgi:thiol-disulfide isomerase/thioredoxin
VNSLITLGIVLFSVLAQARITDDQTIYKVDKEILQITTKKGFHLNAEGPASATFDNLEAIFKPTKKTEKEIIFKIVQKSKSARINFYVCDDKKTVCEQHKVVVDLVTGKASTPEEKKSTLQKTTEKFVLSDNKKPTLLLFAAPWCPACIRMKTETFVHPKVVTLMKKTNFKILNSDLPENYEISEKFQVRAIPTLILLNADGEEVYRWLDYQQPRAFAKSLAAETRKNLESKGELEKKASLGDTDAASALGMMAYNTLNCAEAVKWLALTKKEIDQKFKLASEVTCAQEAAEKDDKKTDEYLEALQKAITLSTSKLDQLRWTVDWLEKKKELKSLSPEAQDKVKLVLKSIETKFEQDATIGKLFSQSTYGEVSGFEKAELLLMKSRLYAILDQETEKTKSDQQIILEVKNKKVSTKRPGEMLLAIAYLREAGETVLVDKMYNELIQKYPKTYVYYEKYSRFLLKQKKSTAALNNVEEALKFTEGNQPQLYLLKARILNEMNRQDKALETVTLALGLEEIKHPKFKKTLAQLNKIKVEAK